MEISEALVQPDLLAPADLTDAAFAALRAVLAALQATRWALAGPAIERRGAFHRGLACLPLKFGARPPME
jgi:hypothetical protein